MNVDCFYCLRYLLMFIIFLNMILGLSLLGASLWVFLHGAKMGQVFAETEGFNYILFFLMTLGAVKFLVGFLGCSSVAKKNSKLLSTFFAMMVVVFLGQVAAGIWLYVDEDKVTEKAVASMATFIQEDYGLEGYEAKTKALDVLQAKFECCGSNEPADWSTSVYNDANETSTLESYMVPPSCCISNDTTTCDIGRRISKVILEGSIYEVGCINSILDQIYTYGLAILGVVIGFVFIELFVMTSSLILCRSKNVQYKL